MEEYKDSGIKWIGKIPQNWEMKHFKYIVSEKVDNRGRTPEIDENDEGMPIIELDAIGNKHPDVSVAKKFINEKSYKKYIRKDIKSGDILFGTVGSIGKCSIVPKDFNYCIAQNIVGYRFNKHQDQLFWYYYFKSEPFKQMYLQYNKGNIQDSIKISDMEQGIVIVPPLDEQRIISKFLDDNISKIDYVLKNLNKQIDILDNYKRSIITEKIINTYKCDMSNNKYKYFDNMPSEYVKRFKDFFETSTGLNITKEDLIDDGLNIISYGQIHSKSNKTTHLLGDLLRYVDYKYETIIKSKVKIGDFIFADTSEDLEGVGNCVLNDNNMNLYAGYHTIIAIPKDRRYSKYLAYLFMTDYWRSQLREVVNGVKVYSITQQILKNTKIIVPPLDTINDITNYLDIECKKIDELIQNKQLQIEKLEIYKQSLIYEYVTGKKRVKGE